MGNCCTLTFTILLHFYSSIVKVLRFVLFHFSALTKCSWCLLRLSPSPCCPGRSEKNCAFPWGPSKQLWMLHCTLKIQVLSLSFPLVLTSTFSFPPLISSQIRSSTPHLPQNKVKTKQILKNISGSLWAVLCLELAGKWFIRAQAV